MQRQTSSPHNATVHTVAACEPPFQKREIGDSCATDCSWCAMDQVVRHFKQSVRTEIIRETGKVIPQSRAAKCAAWLLSKTKHQIVSEFPRDHLEYNEFRADDARKMIEAIFDHRACRMAMDDEIDRVIVGRQHYEEILRYEINHPIGMPVEMRFSDGNELRKVGIYVQCVPWIDGFAIIPKKR